MEGNANSYINKYILPDAAQGIDIPENVLADWQSIVDLIARIGGARAGLIMRVVNNELEVFVASNTKHPYVVGTKEPLLHSGLYCEQVLQQDKLLFVANALKSTLWQNNPDIKYNMICYLGFPIKLPDGNAFGTICILDDKENCYSADMISLTEKMRDLIESHLKLLSLSYNDQLTGLYNRTFFSLKITEAMKRTERYKVRASLLILDVDHFKKINDTWGHSAGDQVLKSIARMITASLRSVDIASRYGGDEFIILLPDTGIDEAVIAATRIRTQIRNRQFFPYGKITVSIGAAEYMGGETLDDWFKHADFALYKAKHSGRNQVFAYDNQRHSIPAASLHLKWKNEWNSGNKQIDEEHKTMVDLGNQVINLSLAGQHDAEITAQLELLLAHISMHFANEEKILTEIGYPNYSEHSQLHRDLVDRALLLKESYKDRKLKPSAFFSFVLDVVIVHMEQEDIKFFPYINPHAR